VADQAPSHELSLHRAVAIVCHNVVVCRQVNTQLQTRKRTGSVPLRCANPLAASRKASVRSSWQLIDTLMPDVSFAAHLSHLRLPVATCAISQSSHSSSEAGCPYVAEAGLSRKPAQCALRLALLAPAYLGWPQP